MNNLKPTQMMLIAGGAVLLISTFLDWRSFRSGDWNGWETEAIGLQGIFVALIGLAIAGGVAAQALGNMSVPDRVLGLDGNQLHLALGFTAFIITFGQQFADEAGVGILLGWLASAAIIAAAIMDMREADSGAPTQF